MGDLRVALFVEGSKDPKGFFERLWKQELVSYLGLRNIDHVFPINKKHLVAMDPTNPPMSGAGEPLDILMARKLKDEPFDVAVVAWDLMPTWAGRTSDACRWRETLELYWYLGMSENLPSDWANWSENKFTELLYRSQNSIARTNFPRIERYGVLALCMEPVFEGLLVASESGIRSALGLERKRVRDWPTGWNDPSVTRPETDLLQKAIRAARDFRPKPKEVQKVGGDMRTAKHEWGVYFIRALFQDPDARPVLEKHDIAKRLREVLRK